MFQFSIDSVIEVTEKFGNEEVNSYLSGLYKDRGIESYNPQMDFEDLHKVFRLLSFDEWSEVSSAIMGQIPSFVRNFC